MPVSRLLLAGSATLAAGLRCLDNNGRGVDWWSLGTMIYEMLGGLPPFYSENFNVMYERILRAPLEFKPPEVFSKEARTLIDGMLQKEPELRLGSSDALADQTLRDGERVRLGLLLEPTRELGSVFRLRLPLRRFAFDAEPLELLRERRDSHLRSLHLVREGFDLGGGGFGGGGVRRGECRGASAQLRIRL